MTFYCVVAMLASAAPASPEEDTHVAELKNKLNDLNELLGGVVDAHGVHEDTERK